MNVPLHFIPYYRLLEDGKRLIGSLVIDALLLALWRRRPEKGQLIHHPDRWVQHASRAFLRH